MPRLLALDRQAGVPLWKQLVDGTVRLVDGGVPPHGERLYSPWWKSSVSTETGEAPAGQGATTETIGEYSREAQRRPAGCIARRMQLDLRHGLFGPALRRADLYTGAHLG